MTNRNFAFDPDPFLDDYSYDSHRYFENTLTSISQIANSQGLVFFSYDSKIKTLLSWSDNIEKVLGANLKTIQREANFLLKYTHEDDRFQLISELDQSLACGKDFAVNYRWNNPTSKKIIWFCCRAKLNIKDEQEILEGVIFEIGSPVKTEIISSLPGINFILDKDLNISDLSLPIEYQGFCFGELEFKSDFFVQGRSLAEALENTDSLKWLEQTISEVFSEKSPNFERKIQDQDKVFNISIRPIKSNQLTTAVLVSITNEDKLAQAEKDLISLKKNIALRFFSGNSIHNLNNLLQAIGGYSAILSLKSSNASTVEITNTCSQIQECLTQAGSILQNLIDLENSATNFQKEPLQKLDLNTCVIHAISRLTADSLSEIKTNFNSVARILAPEKFLLRYLEKLFSLLLENTKILTIETFALRDCAKLEILYKKPASEYFELTRFLSKEDQQDLEDSKIKLKRSLLRNSAEIIEISLPLAEQTHQDLSTINNQTDDCVLIVDDDLRILKATSEILKSQKISSINAQNVLEAKFLLEQKPQNLKLAVVDGLLPHEPGAELIKFIKFHYPQLIIIGLTGSNKGVQKALLNAGAAEVFRKPISPFILASKIRDAINSEPLRGSGKQPRLF